MRTRLATAFCLSLLLSGCSLSPTGVPTAAVGRALKGSVHGGQQPISGSHIYLFAANTTGYGSASSLVLDAGLTDSGGNFSISGNYSCTPDTQVYIYALERRRRWWSRTRQRG